MNSSALIVLVLWRVLPLVSVVLLRPEAPTTFIESDQSPVEIATRWV